MPAIRIGKVLLGTMFGLVLNASTQAAILYEQELLEFGSFGFLSNFASDETADNFSLGGASELTGLRWYGSYFPDTAVSSELFEVSIFDNTDFSSQLFTDTTNSFIRTNTGFVDDAGSTIYQYDYSFVTPFALGAGDYLLSVSNFNRDFFDWYWADSLSANGDGTVYFNGVASWIPDSAAGVWMAARATATCSRPPFAGGSFFTRSPSAA